MTKEPGKMAGRRTNNGATLGLKRCCELLNNKGSFVVGGSRLASTEIMEMHEP